MSDYLRDLQKRYNALAVPEPLQVITGPEESVEISRQVDLFIDSAAQSLHLSTRALSSFFKVEHRTLQREHSEQYSVLFPTNDFDTSFWLDGVQPLVSARSVRDDYNYRVIVFAKYALLDRTTTTLLRIYENDTPS